MRDGRQKGKVRGRKGKVEPLFSFFRGHGRIATIDAAKAAPPPSPLAPIDLTDPGQVAGVMHIAARIGDILLSSGTGNNDTKAQIHAVTSAYGLHYTHVDITMNTITLFTHMGTFKTPVSVFRVVNRLGTNFGQLAEVDRLIRSIQAGATSPDMAEKILDQILSAKPEARLLRFTLGWAVMAAAVAVLLGGGFLVAAISSISAAVIMLGSELLDKQNLPPFFQNIYGGFVATVPAAVAYIIAVNQGFSLAPSQIIASGIVVMLAGLTLVQALQDGITGAPVTASARFFETMLVTGGIVAGVAIGIQVSAALGIHLPPIETNAPPNFASATVKVISGAVASAAFAVACYVEWKSMWIAGLTAAAGSSVYYFLLLPNGVGPVVGIGISATIIGLSGGLLARRYLIPPLIVSVSGITPLLPGLAIYRGMYAVLNEQLLTGFTNMALALAIATSLGAGVVLGEWIARKLRRPPTFNPYRAFRARRRFFHKPTPPLH
ncbi:threonine/serine exporter family protein [Corynebacterium hindlerae]|uniref:threonine/serine exporter ThrE n=1 Tax=Corynebacterium hindlerae TaxID=699041 RepID=UPI001AD60620|nr:threonine/serine exporter family protein [Corynebacterium hindlerae]